MGAIKKYAPRVVPAFALAFGAGCGNTPAYKTPLESLAKENPSLVPQSILDKVNNTPQPNSYIPVVEGGDGSGNGGATPEPEAGAGPAGGPDPDWIQRHYSGSGDAQDKQYLEKVSPADDPESKGRECVSVEDDLNTIQDVYPIGLFFGRGKVAVYNAEGFVDTWDLDQYAVPISSLIGITGKLIGCAEE